MEANPPSYGQATTVNAWDLIAGYIPSSDLCSAALVCQQWHATFAPHLWGNPASHFGDENDRVYVALTRFIRTLPWARRAVRSLTHTLHLPPAHAEIYNGPHADWLREVLEGLPNLQSLIVRGLPFFEHASLNALRYTRLSGNRNQLVPAQTPFGLRLLDASVCSNVTATGLQQALRRFDALLYLDLSWTYPAKSPEVLRGLSQFRGLQVLKLRGISLKDDDVLILANAIKTRLRSLDLRNNQLTDRSVRVLLEQCFTLPPRRDNDGRVMSPSLLPYLGAEMLSTYRGVNFEAFLRNEFTNKFVGRLAIEDAPESGITHLYLSDNQLTVEGLSGLIRSGRLHVLDAGSLLPAMTSRDGSFSMSFPSLAKLVPVLAESASHSLTYLRIDHSLVTEEPPAVQENINKSPPQRCELADTSNYPVGVAELDHDTEIYEMMGDTSFPTEVSGDAVPIVVTPSAFEKPTAGAHKARRGSQDLPIPVQTEDIHESGLHVITLERENDSSLPVLEETLTPTSMLPSHGIGRSYSSIVKERKSRLQAHLIQAKSFHPGILPHLTTLVLTEVPPSTPTPETPQRLISFIHSCAEETSLAKLQAQLDWTLPPGRRTSHSHQKELLRKSFALEQVVLEVAPYTLDQKKNEAASAWRHRGTKSMTQDQDSEALWAASQTDFSFFGEGETNSLDTFLEPPKPLSIMSGMEVSVNSPSSSSHHSPPQPATDSSPKPEIDVIAQLSKFRKATKTEYQSRLAKGEEEPTVEGFWDGNIKVVRKAKDVIDPKFEDDEVWADYYGNRFSNGYLYR
ncbi:uncharacterized protein M437DRAFT_37954 [Aureobasidium melanogenum CBS 110374]|uniref:RNI-like protein n=1 Tax=Aureobasidium melanogenum (strain CBS 110374) TaxID=1043003 RepID=A0A074WZF6_AURM1|nr:uncharacterized protein M437DRAFT_37954 [Aureobasidium melanogenum CBS 110374]KEQ67796.1 hypothetical protein M437DRAFT_37954 [Aureobasidium melanogenum CBS 110374]